MNGVDPAVGPSAGAAAAPVAVPATSSATRRVVATLLVGVGAGVGGLVLSVLLHAIQHLAYAYGVHPLFGDESFLVDVGVADARQRFVALVACGVVAGVGWWLLDRFGRPRVDVAAASKPRGARLPGATTVIHALLQVVTVALGSPLGREVAPREIGALWAQWIGERVGIDADTRRILLACGAGAGLAAVYNVPLAGALFTLEVLLVTFAWDALVPALATSVVAALVAWAGLGNVSQYVVPAYPLDASLVAWSVVAGPFIGVAAYGFRRLTTAARPKAKDGGWRRALLCVVAFAAIGAVSGWVPEILGNGKLPAQLAFDGAMAPAVAALVLALKVLAVLAALRVGAHGGVLTPGLACGALVALALGAGWSMLWPGPAPGAYAVIGAAAFLASSMAMPLTTIALAFEFTRVGHDFAFPIVIAVAGSVATSRWCAVRAERRAATVAGASGPR